MIFMVSTLVVRFLNTSVEAEEEDDETRRRRMRMKLMKIMKTKKKKKKKKTTRVLTNFPFHLFVLIRRQSIKRDNHV